MRLLSNTVTMETLVLIHYTCPGKEGVSHVIDPKAISKDVLYGTMDPNTREWTDGLFTHILRKIIDNVRGKLFNPND